MWDSRPLGARWVNLRALREGISAPAFKALARINEETNKDAGSVMGKSLGSLLVSIALVTAFSLLITTGHAHAYIDAGTGSLLLQVMLAGVFGTLFMLKVFWRKVTGQISRVLSRIKGLKRA